MSDFTLSRISKSDSWRTPKDIYQELDKEFKFDFDPCPYPRSNFDGLKIDWGSCNFVNPPYSETEKWVKKAVEEHKKGKTVIMLLRLDASTKWFRNLVLPNAEIRLFDDRLHFINTKGISCRSPFSSILVVFNNSKKRLDLHIIYWRKQKELIPCKQD
jgi:phage N-6-adenine-methyltransferase